LKHALAIFPDTVNYQIQCSSTVHPETKVVSLLINLFIMI